MSQTADTEPSLLTSPSQTKISGFKAPSKLLKPSSLQKPNFIANPKISPSSSIIINESDFKVGENCWVNGSKPGLIAFIGETQFKEGIWAGIILETADGKNNGTLQGVSYFTTEENHGVFCRLNKLTRDPDGSKDDNKSILNQSITVESNIAQSVTGSVSQESTVNNSMKIGCRVLINNTTGPTKVGVLRFIGATEFAKGEWAGVELDEKQGKNDGSIANKRYFQCKPMYGVFAPIAKIQVLPEKKLQIKLNSSISTRNTRSPSGLIPKKPLLNKQLSGSQESLTSSVFSTASAVRPKLGIMSKIGVQTPNLSTLAAKKTALNQPVLQSLKEKESHIAQLLKERDFERAEFTRAAQKFEETESNLLDFSKQLEERNNELVTLKDKMKLLDEKNYDLSTQLDNDKSRIEDLEFQIEEHKLGSDDDDVVKIGESGDSKKVEINQESEESIKAYLESEKVLKEQVETLNIELKQLRLGEEVYSQEKTDLKKSIESLETKLSESYSKVTDLSKVEEHNKNLELEKMEALKTNDQAIEKLKIEIVELNSKLSITENQKGDVEFQFEEEKVKYTDLKNQLDEKNKEVINLKVAQNQNETDIEFSLEEQKVFVQELETKLGQSETENISLKASLEAQNLQNNVSLKEKDDEEKVKFDQLSVNLEKCELELSEKTEKLVEKETYIENINMKLETYTNDSGTQSKELSEKDGVITSLKYECENLKEQNEQNKNSTTSEHKILNEKIEDVTGKFENIQKENDDLNEKINILNKDLEAKSSEEKAQIQNLENKQTEFESLQQELKNLEINRDQELTLLKEKFEKSDSETLFQQKQADEKYKGIEVQFEESKKTNNELQSRISEMMTNSGDYSTQLTTLNEQLVEKEKDIEEHQITMAKLQQDNLNKENEKTGLETMITELKAKIDLKNIELEKSKEIYDSKLEIEIEKQKELERKLENKDNNIETYESDLTKLKGEIEGLNSDINKEKMIILSQTTDLENSKKIINDQNEELLKIKGEYDQNTEGITKVESELNEKNSQLEKLKEKFEEEKEAMNKKLELLIKENGEKISLKSSELVEKENVVSDLIKEKTRLEEKISKFSSDSENKDNLTNDENNNLKLQINTLNSEIIEFKKSHENFLSENEILKNEKDILTEKNKDDCKNNDIKMAEFTESLEKIKLDHNKEKIILGEEISLLKKANEECKTESKENIQKIDKEIENFKTLKLNLESEKEDLLKEKDVLNNEKNRLKKDHITLETEKNGLVGKIKDLEKTIENNQTNSSAEINESVVTLKGMLLEATQQIEILKGTQSDFVAQLNNLQEMISENDILCEVKNNEILEFKSQIEVYISELCVAGETITSLENSKENLTHQNNELTEENQEYKTYFISLEESRNSIIDPQTQDAKAKQGSIKVAPRLFCDICDEFDLHDTEDCPQQLMVDDQDDKSLHSKNDGSAVIHRAYCDICQSFGHEEDDCPNPNDKAPSDEEF